MRSPKGWLLTVSLLLPATGLAQDIVRHCTAEIVVRSVDGDGAAVTGPGFRAEFRASSRAMANEARRAARSALILCVNTHWDQRMEDGTPPACTTFAGVHDYPYSSLFSELRHDFCGENGWDGTRHTVDVLLYINGRKGCLPEHGIIFNYNEVATGIAMTCPPRVGRPGSRGMRMLPGVIWPTSVATPYNVWTVPQAPDSEATCVGNCARDRSCWAWTFNRTPDADGRVTCLLYDDHLSLDDTVPQPGFISGVKR